MSKPLKKRASLAPALWATLMAGMGVGIGHCAAQEQKTMVLAFSQIPAGSGRGVACNARIAETLLGERYIRGGRVVVRDALNALGAAGGDGDAGAVRVVSVGFSMAADPAFSFDGKRMLFAGQRSAGEPIQIWEVDPRSEKLAARRVVSCAADCIQPAYLPDGSVVFASLLGGEYEEHGGKRSFSLYRVGRGESEPTRITFNPSSEIEPAVLGDGRIMFSSWQHVGNHFWPTGVFCLMTVNSDGTGVWALTGNHRGGFWKRGAVRLGGDRIGFVSAERGARFGAGELLGTSMNDAFSAYATIVARSEGVVADAALAGDGGVVVSAMPAEGGTETFGLYRVGEEGLTKLFDDPAYHELSPAVGRAQARPPRRISVVDESKGFAWVAAINCYKSEIAGRERVAPGSIARVRVLQGLPIGESGGKGPAFVAAAGREDEPLLRASSATGGVPVRILGEVPVEADGSFYAKVPADVPLRLQLIDREGFSAVNQRAWFWLRPGERRVCIGCHENRELAPPNVAVEAVRKAPADLTDPAGWRTVSFRRDIEGGIISSTCSAKGCHARPNPTAAMNLSPTRRGGEGDGELAEMFGAPYANLLRRQEGKPFGVGGRLVHPGDARGSPLMWMLYGRRLGAGYSPAPFDRAMVDVHPGPEPLDDEVLDLFRTWIELGAQFDDECAVGAWPHTHGAPGSTTSEQAANPN